VLSMVRHQILPDVVQLRCLDANGEEVQSGSGLYTTDASGSYVDTDAHVLRADDGKYYGCNIYFPMPDSGAFYQSAYFAGPDSAKLYDKNKSVVDGQEVDGIDFAEIKIDGAFTDEKGAMYPLPPQQHDGYAPMDRACVPYQQAPFEIGSHMYTLGYPGVGDDSITFTDGVISGFTGQYGEYVKGSATTAPGSSGGVVIESNTGCFVGFIDSVETDSGGTIAHLRPGRRHCTGAACIGAVARHRRHFYFISTRVDNLDQHQQSGRQLGLLYSLTCTRGAGHHERRNGCLGVGTCNIEHCTASCRPVRIGEVFGLLGSKVKSNCWRHYGVHCLFSGHIAAIFFGRCIHPHFDISLQRPRLPDRVRLGCGGQRPGLQGALSKYRAFHKLSIACIVVSYD
jgi:hypothetical protein